MTQMNDTSALKERHLDYVLSGLGLYPIMFLEAISKQEVLQFELYLL